MTFKSYLNEGKETTFNNKHVKTINISTLNFTYGIWELKLSTESGLLIYENGDNGSVYWQKSYSEKPLDFYNRVKESIKSDYKHLKKEA